MTRAATADAGPSGSAPAPRIRTVDRPAGASKKESGRDLQLDLEASTDLRLKPED